MKKVMVWLFMVLFPVAFLACGGGGGSSNNNNDTTATAMTVASKVSVVDAQLSGSVASGAAPLKIGWSGIMKALSKAPATSSDYYTDKTQVWVNERSVESLDNVNNILCMVGQTKYDAMLNKGNYIALVDRNQCNSDKSNASTAGQDSQNQSSSATMPDYMKFVVNSSRIDDNHNEIVEAWVHQTAGGHDQPALIFAHIVISEGTSSTNPYGIFQLNFAGYPLDSSGAMIGYPSTPAFNGTLRAVRAVPSDPTSKVLLQFVQDERHVDNYCGTVTSVQKVTLDRQPDGAGGAGHVYESRSSTLNTSSSDCNGSVEFDIAYNLTDFFREDLITNGTFCLSRGAFSESAWSYGLYDSTGARVNRNSGFPITYTSGTTSYNGFIGYWGLWIDNSAPTIPNGATVNKVDYNNGSSTSASYTVFKSGGKLKKHTQKLLTLNDIKGIPLNYWEQPASGGTGTNYQVVWDGTNFNKTAQMPQNCSNNCYWADITTTPTPTIDVTHLPWGNLNFWSDSLSGQAQVPLSNCTYTTSVQYPNGYTSCDLPTNSTQVIFYAENLVYPGDTIPTTLACYDNCPNAPTAAGVDLTLNNGYVIMSSPSASTNYTFDGSTMTLILGGNPVISTTTSSTQQWGIMSGPLFDPTPTNMNALACPWDNTQTCGWQAWSVLPEFYTWETGPNNYNQFIALKDATNTFLKFDPPLQVKYVGLGAPYGTLGTSFMLQYCGFGQLNGIPGKCVDIDTGLDADCSQAQNSQSIRWVPQFTIPAHDTSGNLIYVTDTSDNTTQYYVKPLQVEQRMKADTPSNCSTLASTDFSAYTLPDMSLWSDPVTADGTEPTVTDAPAVIGGVVQ